MIDTVCLLIPKDRLGFIEGISNWELYSTTDSYWKFVRNASKAEKETGKYFPKLTGYTKRFSQDACVRIELSLPKLLYGNNLDELNDNDFQDIVDTLQERLKDMGVLVSKTVIENASVSSVHYSKNIPLKNGYTSSYLISEMNKVNLRKNLDFARTKYINGGQSLYAHNSSHQFVIYDKIADLSKSKERAVDKNQTDFQKKKTLEMLSKIELKEVIRFEVRLNRKPKMNRILRELGYKVNPTLKDIFSSEISKTVVIDYWQKLIKQNNLGVFSISLTLGDMLETMFLADSKIKPKQAVYFLGLVRLSRDEGGLRSLRGQISRVSNDRTWYRMVRDTKYISELITKNNLRDWVKQIDSSLDDYNPYKII